MSQKNKTKVDKDLRLQQWLDRQKSNKPTSSGISRLPEGTPAVLSSGQHRLWLLQQLYPGNPFYHYAEVYNLKGNLRIEALIESFKKVVERHDILRTTFKDVEGEAIQQIHSEPEIDLANFDLQHLSGKNQEEKAEAISVSESSRPFDLEKGPLVRVSLIQLADYEFRLVVSMHHIITDKWSMRVLRDEWSMIYHGKEALPPLEIQYADFSWWQRNQKVDQKHLDYWKNQLSGDLPQLKLPYDFPRPSNPSFKGSYSEQVFSPQLHRKLQALCKDRNTTMFVLLLAVYNVLLHRYSGQADLLVGAPVTNRDHTSLENLIGFFNETIVLRSDLSGNPRFIDLVQQVRSTVLEAFSHKNVPFESLVQVLKPERYLSSNPLFQVMFLYHKVPPTPVFDSELQLEYKPQDVGVSKFDFTLYFSDDEDHFSANIEYTSDLFAPDTIKQMETHLRMLMEAVADDPTQRISGLQMLTEPEQEKILKDWNNTASPAEDITSIHKLIEAQVAAHPEHKAVVFGGQAISYQTLNERADQVAAHILAAEVPSGCWIGLCTDRSHELIIGLLGILKAGCGYVPMDPEYPVERLHYMIKDANMPLIVTQAHLTGLIDTENVPLLAIDQLDSIRTPNHKSNGLLMESEMAYLIYTSGSTAEPKGVPVSHANLIHSTTARFNYYKDQPGVFLLLSSFSFDSSVAGIFWSLCGGGTLVLCERRIEQDLERLTKIIADQSVTHTLMLPTLYDVILQYAPREQLATLKTIIVAGEACSPKVCQRHFEILPAADLYNEYGPTEATVWSTVHHIQPEDSKGPVPIGRPIANTQQYILDPNLQPVPLGVTGELYIGGSGVTKGYLNRSDLTEANFIVNPFSNDSQSRLYKTGDRARYRKDGVIECLGRVDHQIKIRGYRIEPEEIQQVLMNHESVQEAVVIVDQQQDQKKRLLGYITGSADMDLKDLRKYAKSKLPDYMVPAALMLLETMPKLPNGKLDKKKLPVIENNPDTSEVGFSPPKTDLEQQLVRIWEEVLNVSSIGIHHNFFEIGGDSILSIQVITRARKAGLQISPSQLFEHQTIAELALFVKSAIEVQDHEKVITGPAILTPIQEWFFEVHRAAPHHWNHTISFELPTDINTDVINQGISHLIERHDALRLAFLKKNDHWIGEVKAPKDIVGFQVIDLSNLSPEIQSQAVSERIAEIQTKTKLAEGGLFQCIYFDCGTQQKHRLILLAHHLIIDTVSWSILIEELASVVQSLKLGQTISLPPTTTSFTKWGAQLKKYANSDSLANQLEFWEAQTQVPEILPSDFEVSFPIAESSITTFPDELPEEQAQLMLTEALKAYNTRPDEMLITALMLALADWNGISELCLGLERHGREMLDESLDLSNSVGWFTAYFPIKLNIDRSADMGMILKTVKEQLRQPVQGGIGYGVLRYLRGHNKLDQQPRILFNYLGNQHGVDSPIFGRGEFIGQDSRDPQNERYYQLEVNAFVTDGKLQTRWSYCRDQFKADNIKHLVTCFNSALQSLIQHCVELESGGYTPSDFPEADLSQSDLDNLFDQL